ncbi:MAG TPA: ATP-dependent DNA helicase RecG [Gammaproteobacteria bacterium]|nr:ATP-dependent DNA helicase RecG [Gammaproteobacteria bacterium]
MSYSDKTPQKPNPAMALLSFKGVGPKSVQKFHKLGISQPVDLLFHLPSRYEDRTKIRNISELQPGESALVKGVIAQSQLKQGRRRSLLVRISDGSRFMSLRFFHFSSYQEKSFEPNKEIVCFGEVRRGPDSLEMIHPDYGFAASGKSLLSDHLTPTYSTTEGLPQKLLRDVISQALEQLKADQIELQNLLPNEQTKSKGLLSLKEAIIQLHEPQANSDTQALLNFQHPAQKRLIFEELLAHHLSLKQIRQRTQRFKAPKLADKQTLSQQFIDHLSFQLTTAQQRVINEILNDLKTARPMLRLVQGDVGSGKTVVAMAVALQAISQNWQVAFMAPTEMLAEQHYENFENWAASLGISIGWLSGKTKGRARKAALEALASGETQLLIGTHALFQADVVYHKLGFVIIDEQHRFGVHQRLALKEKTRDNNLVPHQLIMTATPIPRTLAMTAYADLDISVIDERPKGRQTIETVVVPDHRRDDVIQRVDNACKMGRQAYWVCPLIEESEALNCQAAENTANTLSGLLADLRIGLVHGRMKSEQKTAVMLSFKQGAIDVLVATTVIEVGVDVPNASLMIIENAERLGLSQLHQLRGRVGRGAIKSNCVLLFHGKLSQVGRERLSIMRETNDGFAIAERDLQIRGPGELLGTKQTGLLQLRVADIRRDQYLFTQVERVAEKMTRETPENIAPLIRRWINHGLQYGNV